MGKDAAFPETWGQWGHDVGGQIGTEGGMTLRDYFAAKAMQSFVLANTVTPPGEGVTCEQVAKDSYQQADAMLTERTK